MTLIILTCSPSPTQIPERGTLFIGTNLASTVSRETILTCETRGDKEMHNDKQYGVLVNIRTSDGIYWQWPFTDNDIAARSSFDAIKALTFDNPIGPSTPHKDVTISVTSLYMR